MTEDHAIRVLFLYRDLRRPSRCYLGVGPANPIGAQQPEYKIRLKSVRYLPFLRPSFPLNNFDRDTPTMQLTLSSLLLVIIPTLAIAQRPPACQPNFQGSVVKAVNPASGKVWSVASNADVGSPVTAGSSAAPLLFSFDGSVNNNYIIKYASPCSQVCCLLTSTFKP
jgi:hypothetical protein